jgi:hypothetical protein
LSLKNILLARYLNWFGCYSVHNCCTTLLVISVLVERKRANKAKQNEGICFLIFFWRQACNPK